MVSTVNYKQESQIDLKKSMEVLQTLESQGAKNMIVKQEDFQTAEGLAVLNLRYFSRLNENTSRDELYYEIVFV
jgi:hypothetical protein